MDDFDDNYCAASLSDFAFKNVSYNKRKYVMYYFSSTVVVSIFFIFNNFLQNPQITNASNSAVFDILKLCEALIILFTLIFTKYSVSSFIVSREKEFGILAVLGMDRNEIRRYVMYENMLMSALSIFSGLIFGILFSKLFFMSIQVVLKQGKIIPFALSVKACFITVILFSILFYTISLIATRKIKAQNILKLLKGQRIVQTSYKVSGYTAFFGACILITAYNVCCNVNSDSIYKNFLPVAMMILVGTYLFFTHIVTFILYKTRSNRYLFYRGTNMLIVSQIMCKLKESTKVMFMSAVFGTVILTTTISLYSVKSGLENNLNAYFPQDISFAHKAAKNYVIQSKNIDEVLKNRNFTIKNKIEESLIKGRNIDSAKSPVKLNNIFVNRNNFSAKSNTRDFYIMSCSEYNAIAVKFNKKTITVHKNEAVINYYEKNKYSNVGKYLKLEINKKVFGWGVESELYGRIINADRDCTSIAVIDDEEFSNLLNKVPKSEQYVYHGYNIDNWTESADAVFEIREKVTSDENFVERVTGFASLMEGTSLTFFIGIFVSVIFFTASSSMVYYRLFNELQKDKREFISLSKLGMSHDEIENTIKAQSMLIYFLPFVMAAANTTFAIKALSNVMSYHVSYYMIIIFLIYFLIQILYYIFSNNSYLKQISESSYL